MFRSATAPTIPHIERSLLALHGPLPARDRGLTHPRDRQLAGRRILVDRRAGGDRRAGADLDRRDERRVRADEYAVADHGTVLVRAVVVARDRAGSDVHIRADGRVADVAQVVDLAAGGDVGLLRLDEVADLHALGEPR